MLSTYSNSWYRSGQPQYGPAAFETDARPAEYRGFLIYNRNPAVLDVVKDGVCVGQYAGPNGARQFIDTLVERAA